MVVRRDVEIPLSGPPGSQLKLRGWLFVPESSATAGASPKKLPAITMAIGYAASREHALERFARVFASAGFVVLVHDHRNFGTSDGDMRGDVDPWQQIADWRRAISFLEAQPEVDASRIGVWGTSFSGGHAIVLGATERRIAAVVSQAPTISGFENVRRRVTADQTAAYEQAFVDDDRAQLRGEPMRRVAVASLDPQVPAVYRGKDAVDFYLQPVPAGTWENSVTYRSGLAARLYEPGIWASRVSPTPLLMIIAMNDTLTVTDAALAAFNSALEPKRLVKLPGGHFDPYTTHFDRASKAALTWFIEHLQVTPREETGS